MSIQEFSVRSWEVITRDRQLDSKTRVPSEQLSRLDAAVECELFATPGVGNLTVEEGLIDNNSRHGDFSFKF